MSHVIDDLGKASNGVVYPQNSDQQLKKLQINQIHVNAFRQGVEDYFRKIRKNKKGNPQYVAGPGVNTEELKNRYSQIQSAICECIKNNQP